MEQLANVIRPGYADRDINNRLASGGRSDPVEYGRCYNQSEEFFIQLASSYGVPSFPIHHDVRQSVPTPAYLGALKSYVDEVLAVAPDFFSDLSYFFDPAETMRPCFYRLYRIGEAYFLYLLRLDLSYRPLEHETVHRGSNDTTAAYRTNRLYYESDFIPLERVVSEPGRPVEFVVRQTISQTWIGETGKGYLVRGIWMDTELTRFFSKLFMPSGRRSYPFFPFTCKYKTLCLTVLDPFPDRRRELLPYLYRAFAFLAPEMEAIQVELKSQSFTESLPLFASIKGRIPEALLKPWTQVSVTPYLNDEGRKEFRVEY